jgi:hypothetical protein
MARRIFTGVHVACNFIGYTLFGSLLSPILRADDMCFVAMVVLCAIPVFGAVAFVTGIAAMAMRSGKDESLLLAFSTIAAFVLMILGSPATMA